MRKIVETGGCAPPVSFDDGQAEDGNPERLVEFVSKGEAKDLTARWAENGADKFMRAAETENAPTKEKPVAIYCDDASVPANRNGPAPNPAT